MHHQIRALRVYKRDEFIPVVLKITVGRAQMSVRDLPNCNRVHAVFSFNVAGTTGMHRPYDMLSATVTIGPRNYQTAGNSS